VDGPVVELLKRTGGNTVDEILVRVPERPQSISSSLRELSEGGYIKVKGPKTINDFEELVKRVKSSNGYEYYSAEKQKSCVLEEIMNHAKDFTRTRVHLSTSGFRLALQLG